MSHFLPYLFFLSCPVSMGLMMWFMMRGTHGGQKQGLAPDPRVEQLEREVQALRTGQHDRQREHVTIN